MALAIGIGVGLAAVAGLRAFLPLALAATLALLALFTLTEPYAVAGELLAVVGGLWALALLELVLDKIRAVERVFNMIMVPFRAAAGAALFAVAMGAGLAVEAAPWLAAGGAVAGAVAVLKVVLRPRASAESAGVSTGFLSVIEDAVALVGGAAGFFVPYLPVLLVAFLLFFYHRVRRRRGRRYKGLRILGD